MVADFINVCSKYECDINLYDGRNIIDGKSIISDESVILLFIEDIRKFEV